MIVRQLVAAIFALLAFAFITVSVQAQDSAEVRCTLGGSSVAGRVVHIDPQTARPTSHPVPDQAAALAALQAAAANRSTKGLVEEPGPTGGVKLNLRNRFRNPLVAVTHEEGGLQVDHLACKPAGDGA